MDSEIKKKVLRRLQYGMYIMTSRSGDDVGAGTINWLSQCSYNPPLIMIGLKKDSHLYEVTKKSGYFVVNILGKSQKDIAASFFRPNQPANSKINGYSFQDSESGGLILVDTPGWFECKVTDWLERGDHSVVIGELTDCGVNAGNDEETILLKDTGWSYGG